MTKKSILFLGTASSVPQPDRYTQSVAICGLRDCILLDVGEGTQIRLASAGIDHRSVKLLAITHTHGDHIYGLLPFLESLGMKAYTQKGVAERCQLKIVAPATLCRYVHLTPEITKAKSFNNHVDLVCIEAGGLYASNAFAYVPSGEMRILPIPVQHGLDEAYGYYVGVDIRGREIGVYYSGDGICGNPCRDRLKQLKPLIVVHEATFLDYPKDRAKAYESFHATVYDAAMLAVEAKAAALVLTHISSRYDKEVLRDFRSRARRLFDGDILIAEDLAKIPLETFG